MVPGQIVRPEWSDSVAGKAVRIRINNKHSKLNVNTRRTYTSTKILIHDSL